MARGVCWVCMDNQTATNRTKGEKKNLGKGGCGPPVHTTNATKHGHTYFSATTLHARRHNTVDLAVRADAFLKVAVPITGCGASNTATRRTRGAGFRFRAENALTMATVAFRTHRLSTLAACKAVEGDEVPALRYTHTQRSYNGQSGARGLRIDPCARRAPFPEVNLAPLRQQRTQAGVV